MKLITVLRLCKNIPIPLKCLRLKRTQYVELTLNGSGPKKRWERRRREKGGTHNDTEILTKVKVNGIWVFLFFPLLKCEIIFQKIRDIY